MDVAEIHVAEIRRHQPETNVRELIVGRGRVLMTGNASQQK